MQMPAHQVPEAQARSMEDMIRQRMRYTGTAGQGQGQQQQAQRPRPQQPQAQQAQQHQGVNLKPFVLFLKSNDTNCQNIYALIAKTPSLQGDDGLRVVNISHEGRPTWLKGVPCLLETNLRTQATRQLYGTNAMQAVEWLAKSVANQAVGDDPFTAAPTAKYASFDESPGVQSASAGATVDYTYEYAKEYTDAGGRVTQGSVDELMAKRQALDQRLATQKPSQKSLPPIAETASAPMRGAASMDELMRRRQAMDARRAASGHAQF